MDAARKRRLRFWAPLALATALVLAWLLRPQPVLVDLSEVARGPLRVVVSDEGESRVREVFVVSAPVSGFLRRIEIHAGDAVTAHETVVARIEPADPSFLDARSAAEARAGVAAAEAARAHGAAELERARAEHEYARGELARLRSLAAEGVASQSALDAAERFARVAAAAVEEARAGLAVRVSDLARARAVLTAPRARKDHEARCDCIDVYSPVTGRVLRVVRESEGNLLAGEPILEVGDPNDLEVAVDLLSTDAVHVVPGQRAWIGGWGGGRELEGVVRRVEPFAVTKISALGIEEQRVNVLIDLAKATAGAPRLGHGFRVEPAIILWESEDVLRAPFSALFRDGEEWAAFVLANGRAEQRRVTLGHQNGLEAEVLAGLAAGERVVVHPSERVAHGVRLRERS